MYVRYRFIGIRYSFTAKSLGAFLRLRKWNGNSSVLYRIELFQRGFYIWDGVHRIPPPRDTKEAKESGMIVGEHAKFDLYTLPYMMYCNGRRVYWSNIHRVPKFHATVVDYFQYSNGDATDCIRQQEQAKCFLATSFISVLLFFS